MAHAASQLKKKADENLAAEEEKEKEKEKKRARKRSREVKKKVEEKRGRDGGWRASYDTREGDVRHVGLEESRRFSFVMM